MQQTLVQRLGTWSVIALLPRRQDLPRALGHLKGCHQRQGCSRGCWRLRLQPPRSVSQLMLGEHMANRAAIALPSRRTCCMPGT